MPDQLKTHEEFQDCLKSNAMVAVDFTATWCGPCRQIAPTFIQLSEDNPEVKFIKIDVDENGETASACKINSMPTFQFFKDGAEVTALGFSGSSKDKLTKAIASLKE